MKLALVIGSVLMLAAGAATAAEKPTKPLGPKQIATLLSAGRTIKVTGAGEHYSGKFVLSADGTATGTATVGAKEVPVTGTWQIKRNLFCHTWQGVDSAEVCEAWVPIEAKKALILVMKVEVGIVTWE